MLSFQQLRRSLRRLALPSMAAVLAVSFGALASAGGTSSAATEYTAYVGGGKAGISVDMFRPAFLVVNAGDSIEFMNPYEEIHTVTYVAGARSGDSWFDLAEQEPFIIVAGESPGGPPKLAINPVHTGPTPASGGATVDGSAFANSGILGKGQT